MDRLHGPGKKLDGCSIADSAEGAEFHQTYPEFVLVQIQIWFKVVFMVLRGIGPFGPVPIFETNG
jgi:hypothetical protein